ncbi:hypothetical protein GCM10018952_14390 [Streptosporangium vulgare]
MSQSQTFTYCKAGETRKKAFRRGGRPRGPRATACGGSSAADEAAPESGKKQYTIGVSNLGLSFPFPAAIRKGIKEEAAQARRHVVRNWTRRAEADKQEQRHPGLMAQQPAAC